MNAQSVTKALFDVAFSVSRNCVAPGEGSSMQDCMSVAIYEASFAAAQATIAAADRDQRFRFKIAIQGLRNAIQAIEMAMVAP